MGYVFSLLNPTPQSPGFFSKAPTGSKMQQPIKAKFHPSTNHRPTQNIIKLYSTQ